MRHGPRLLGKRAERISGVLEACDSRFYRGCDLRNAGQARGFCMQHGLQRPLLERANVRANIDQVGIDCAGNDVDETIDRMDARSEEHTSDIQSQMPTSYA